MSGFSFLASSDVTGQRDVNRARPRCEAEPNGAAYLCSGIHTVEGQRKFRDRLIESRKIELLVRGERSCRERVRSGDGDQRRTVEIGVGYSERHVDRAWTQRRHA